MKNVNDLKIGEAFFYKNTLYMLLDMQHKKTARQQAVIKAKVRNLDNDSILMQSFTSSTKVEQVYIDNISLNYLYSDNDNAYFVEPETYEQYTVSLKSVENEINYLYEGLALQGRFYEKRLIALNMPASVCLKVSSTADNASKGNTVSGATKPATLETGLICNVPLFIKTGEKIIISTANGKYMSKNKGK